MTWQKPRFQAIMRQPVKGEGQGEGNNISTLSIKIQKWDDTNG